MNIFIPIGGKGLRFKNAGYKNSKPLINIFDKCLLFYVLDNLDIHNEDDVYIIYNKKLDNQNFSKKIIDKFPHIILIPIYEETEGAAETLYKGLTQCINNIKKTNKNIVLDCDTMYKNNILDCYRCNKYNNIIFYRKQLDNNQIYSYIELDSNRKVLNIAEKKKISNNANTGAYCFGNINDLYNYCKFILDKKIMFNKEYYTSCVINEMIKNKKEFYGVNINVSDVISLGTPEDVNNYINNTKFLLFDLDGTLVNTDYIYIKVWKQILKRFNIICDNKFFDYFIKGKSDSIFLNNFFPNISDKEISHISNEKDILFIEYLSKENNILFDGVYDMFETNKFNKIAIVTSCNKKAAKFILEKTGLNKYIDLIIASEDCINHKPNPEPYNNTLKYFNVSNYDNVFIFEDSFSGYSSAIRTDIRNICVIDNENSSIEIKNCNAFKYNNYISLDLNNVKDFYKNKNINKENTEEIINKIKKNLISKPVKKIYSTNKWIKTGYICDIQSFKLHYINNENEDIILKMSNFNNGLSQIATKLNMYENENFFYKNISHLIENTPKYFGSFKDNDKDAIIIEDLNKYKGAFNIDLNNNIMVLLKVIENIFEIHNTFRFETENSILKCMSELKKINQNPYFKQLIGERYEKFKNNTKHVLTEKEKNKIETIINNIDIIYDKASQFPLSFCHGDFKSPNIFYKNNKEPILLDWQYIHLNKGISDIVFLLVESIDFDMVTVDIVINYYYKLQNEKHNTDYNVFIEEFKNALCIFPLFVCIWFNSETTENLIDAVFPIKFMKNLMKYYNHFLD